MCEAAWPDLVASRSVLAVPLGATEQRGPHLPLTTDTDIAVAVVERLAARRDDVLAAPAFPYGSSGEHAGFAGTLSIGAAATERVVVELGRSATDSFERVLLVSTHGGNHGALRRAARTLRAERRDVRVFTPAWEGDAHAGRVETSLMLAIRPEQVRLERAQAGNCTPLPQLIDRLRSDGVRAVSENGVLGDPADASASEGELLLGGAVEGLCRLLDGVGGRVTGVAIVTGAARGIGAATVRQLAQEGWQVLAVDRGAPDPRLAYPLGSEQELRAVAAQAPGLVEPVLVDVTQRDALERVVQMAITRHGGLDAFIAAAGVIAGGVPLWELEPERERAVFDVCLHAVALAARVAVPALLARSEPRVGRFLAVSSSAGLRARPLLAAYSAAKAGVVALVQALALELRGTGVTANAVCPGSTRTSMLDESARLYGVAGAEEFAEQQPLERLIEPEEVAAMLVWLAGKEGSALTGAALAVDGGLSL